MKFFKTIRGQLNFYFVLIFGITLCIFSLILYTVFAGQNRDELDKTMLILAGSVYEEIQNGKIQHGLADELKEIFIPYSNPKQQFVEIIDESGKTIFKLRDINSSFKQALQIKSINDTPVFETSEVAIDDSSKDSYGTRILTYPVTHKGRKYYIVVAESLSNMENAMFKFRLILFITIPSILLLSSFFGWIFSKRVYAPVTDLINNSDSISAHNLEARLPVSDSGDEISRLAITLNSMMERLQKSFLVLKQFTSDASHELKTPLTILKGEIEVALNKERSVDEYGRVLRNNLEEVKRLQKIVDGLLTLSKMESDKIKIHEDMINIDELLIEAVSKINYIAKEKNIKVLLKFDENGNDDYSQLFVMGDYSKLLNVFINLLDNAVKYSSENNEVICSEKLNAVTNEVEISIRDFGPGILPENFDNIFNRFYREDTSRTRNKIGGTGLGLSISKSVIEAHSGKISVESKPGEGAVFKVLLPAFKLPE